VSTRNFQGVFAKLKFTSLNSSNIFLGSQSRVWTHLATIARIDLAEQSESATLAVLQSRYYVQCYKTNGPTNKYFIHIFSNCLHYAVLKMMCTPLSVLMMSLNSPTCRANAASSNGFCIWPFENGPRLPFCECEEQSEWRVANSSNFSRESPNCDRYLRRISVASSLVRVMFSWENTMSHQVCPGRCIHTSFQLDGRRLSLCFTNRWLAVIVPAPPLLPPLK
jgi:hypothetical protein